MITKAKLLELVDDNINEKQVDGFTCVGHGINFKVYGVEVPFSLTELLGIEYKDLYQDSGDTTNGEPRMIYGFYGALTDELYYITDRKYQFLLDTLIV